MIKSCGDKKNQWSQHFHAALWADRTTTRRSTGYTPYHLLYGTPHIFPFDIKERTWYTEKWGKVANREDLLALRTRQIMEIKNDRDTAADRTLKARIRAARDYAQNNKNRLTDGQFNRNQMVIVSHKRIGIENRHHKLDMLWSGPYRIHNRNASGSYILKELSGEVIEGSIPPRFLKPFYPRDEIEKNRDVLHNEETSTDKEEEIGHDEDFEPYQLSHKEDLEDE